MGSVLDIENGMTKTGLAVCWVLWLWICHAAGQWGHVIFNYASKLEDIYIYISGNMSSFIQSSYFVAKPSIFPPSPMVM
jgi:hypothetical protein